MCADAYFMWTPKVNFETYTTTEVQKFMFKQKLMCLIYFAAVHKYYFGK